MNLGQAIRRFRGSRTQKDLAKTARMTPSTWSDYERGKRIPRQKQLLRIAAALGCEVAALELAALVEVAVETGESAESLLMNADRELRDIENQLDILLRRKKLLMALRQYLVGLAPGSRVAVGERVDGSKKSLTV